MAYFISDECVSCGACAGACPLEIIELNDAGSQYQIDADACIECGSCASVCPMSAISVKE